VGEALARPAFAEAASRRQAKRFSAQARRWGDGVNFIEKENERRIFCKK
jgi:hypothetical protein